MRKQRNEKNDKTEVVQKKWRKQTKAETVQQVIDGSGVQLGTSERPGGCHPSPLRNKIQVSMSMYVSMYQCIYVSVYVCTSCVDVDEPLALSPYEEKESKVEPSSNVMLRRGFLNLKRTICNLHETVLVPGIKHGQQLIAVTVVAVVASRAVSRNGNPRNASLRQAPGAQELPLRYACAIVYAFCVAGVALPLLRFDDFSRIQYLHQDQSQGRGRCVPCREIFRRRIYKSYQNI